VSAAGEQGRPDRRDRHVVEHLDPGEQVQALE